jgi:hypothetical protein
MAHHLMWMNLYQIAIEKWPNNTSRPSSRIELLTFFFLFSLVGCSIILWWHRRFDRNTQSTTTQPKTLCSMWGPRSNTSVLAHTMVSRSTIRPSKFNIFTLWKYMKYRQYMMNRVINLRNCMRQNITLRVDVRVCLGYLCH